MSSTEGTAAPMAQPDSSPSGHSKLNSTQIKATLVGALGGLLFGFDTAVIAGTLQSPTSLYDPLIVRRAKAALLGVTIQPAKAYGSLPLPNPCK